MRRNNEPASILLSHRLARQEDIPAIVELMRVSIAGNMKEFLSPAEIAAAHETMGVDHTLIKDETYFVVQADDAGKSIMVGCGGWGKRRTLYGGDHTVGRDDTVSNPATEPARIRAMYTHPEWTRCGIGTLLLDLGEGAARDAGFRTIELGSTVSGEPLYLARGYKEVSRESHTAVNGATSIVITMTKAL